MENRQYAQDTYLTQSFPWGLYHGGAALCSDGKVRRISRISETADTFFSVPATVKVNGKSVAGYISIETVSGLSTPTESDPAIVRFHSYKYRKNGHLLP